MSILSLRIECHPMNGWSKVYVFIHFWENCSFKTDIGHFRLYNFHMIYWYLRNSDFLNFQNEYLSLFLLCHQYISSRSEAELYTTPFSVCISNVVVNCRGRTNICRRSSVDALRNNILSSFHIVPTFLILLSIDLSRSESYMPSVDYTNVSHISSETFLSVVCMRN